MLRLTATSGRLLSIASVTVLLVAAFAVGFADGKASARADMSQEHPRSQSPAPAADHIRYRPEVPRIPFGSELEPYPFFAPAPARRPTAIDGYYMRIVTLPEVGGPHWGLPFHCRRCPAFRVDPGVETLLLYRGRYFLEHQMSAFRAYGHYEVGADRVAFFNDANCSRLRGTYLWSRTGSDLVFDVIHDTCPFEDERADDLTFSPWTQVRPCLSGIRYWWPALIGCRGE